MVDVEVIDIVLDARVTVLRVALPAGLPCANAVPHITLGTAEGVAPVESNAVLQSNPRGEAADAGGQQS